MYVTDPQHWFFGVNDWNSLMRMLIRELVNPESGMEKKSNPGSTYRIRNADFYVIYLMKKQCCKQVHCRQRNLKTPEKTFFDPWFQLFMIKRIILVTLSIKILLQSPKFSVTKKYCFTNTIKWKNMWKILTPCCFNEKAHRVCGKNP